MAQGLVDAPRCNVLGAPEHDVERLVALIVDGFRVGVAVNGLHLPLGVLEHHLLILILLGVHLLFALTLSGRCELLARLLLYLTKLFHELLDFPTLTHVVTRRVMFQAPGIAIITVGQLMGALVTSRASAPTCCL
jgi:hypothetical protein